MELYPGESIKYELAANLRKGIEYVRGTLTITNKRFLFHPHGFNIQKNDVEFDIQEIAKIDLSKTLGLIPYGLFVKEHDGAPHTFAVEQSYMVKRDHIISYVQDKISA